MKKTKIICTLGPATDNEELLAEMLSAGMDVARFNFSHGSYAEHAMRLEMLRRASAKTGKTVAAIADTRGPEMRLGIFSEGRVSLKEGDSFCLTTEECAGNERMAHVNYEGLPGELSCGDLILLADGLLSLRVERIRGSRIFTQVLSGGELSSRKRVACPGLELKLPFLSEQDRQDILFAAEHGMDYVAASFVQKKEDVFAIRQVLEEAGSGMGIIAKIENAAGVEHIDEIIDASDAVMVARGDLGVEIPTEAVPLVQKKIIALCNKAGKPVITATQMLESMVHSVRATRAEASDVANSIYDGSDATMLSGETASGKYPLESLRTMAKIAVATEASLDYADIFRRKGLQERTGATEAISHAAVQIAHEIAAQAILTVTKSGFTARTIAKYRPRAPIVAVSPDIESVRAMRLFWGVEPLLGAYSENSSELLRTALKIARSQGVVKAGAPVVITAGIPLGKEGNTNLIKVVTCEH